MMKENNMKNIQKFGAFASLVFGISFIALLVLLITISDQGYTPGSGNNPAKALEFAASSPIPYIIYLLYALFAILMTLIALAMADQLQTDAPTQMRFATVAASTTSILFLVYAMLGYIGEPTLIAIYRQDVVLGASAYIATRVVSNALNTAAIFASGWAVLLIGLAALRAEKLPKLLAGLMVLAGLLSILAFLIPVFALLAPLLYIVWSIWLGIVLLRKSASQTQFVPLNNV
jgi:hypothetical protein